VCTLFFSFSFVLRSNLSYLCSTFQERKKKKEKSKVNRSKLILIEELIQPLQRRLPSRTIARLRVPCQSSLRADLRELPRRSCFLRVIRARLLTPKYKRIQGLAFFHRAENEQLGMSDTYGRSLYDAWPGLFPRICLISFFDLVNRSWAVLWELISWNPPPNVLYYHQGE